MKIMNNELKDRVLALKAKLKRGDMARIVERVSRFGIEKYDVYNILNGKSLVDHQKLIIVMKEVKRCIDENEKYLQEFEMKISEGES
jgi:hypothetical protein